MATILLSLAAGAASAQTWETLHDFDTIVDHVFVTEDGGIGAGLFFGDYYRSSTGITWDLLAENIFLEDVVREGDILYAASLAGVLISSDEGRSWDVLMPSDAWSIYVSGSQIAAGGGGGQLYVSDDAGQTWRVTTCETMPLGFDSYVRPVMIRENVQIWGHAFTGAHTSVSGADWTYEDSFRPDFIVETPEGTTLSNDGSILLEYAGNGSWTSSGQLPTSFADHLVIRDQSRILVGTRLHVSGDGGVSWVELELPADEHPYAATIDQTGRVVTGTSCCVRRTVEPIADLVATRKQSEIADVRTELRPPNPNPAPNGTAIRFVLERPANIRIDVVDAAGRTLDSLIDTDFPTGPHDLWWDTGHLASGTYFVRMRAGGRVFSRPVAVVR